MSRRYLLPHRPMLTDEWLIASAIILTQADVAKMQPGGEQQFSATDIIDFEVGRNIAIPVAKISRVAGSKRW